MTAGKPTASGLPRSPADVGGAGRSPAPIDERKIYFGVPEKGPGPRKVTVLHSDGTKKPLRPRNDLDNHSPDGLNWGYGGSGPAQLALALLADALGDDRRAVALHQEFKWHSVARWPADKDWRIEQRQIVAIAASLEAAVKELREQKDYRI